ncbi:MAG: OmpA family protein [Proteobacteria bacterium]|nr:OmpA family protein [Pseudomonadota bacterium]
MRKLIISITTASILALSGCETFDAYTGESKTSSTAKGAGIGASIGAVFAYLKNKDKSSSERKKAMLKAAGIGAIAGGGVGYYMDTQEAKLRKQLRDTGVSVERDGDNINLIMPSNITFASGGSTLSDSFFKVMDSVVLVVQEFEKTIIVSAGHTDSQGSDSSNQSLSERRAKAVADYLLQKGVAAARIETIGFGEMQPVSDNGTSAGRALNRRVEISLFPISDG